MNILGAYFTVERDFQLLRELGANLKMVWDVFSQRQPTMGPRETSLESLAKLKGVVRPDGTVTAGNASGVNDGACALLLAGERALSRHGLTPHHRRS